MMDTLVAMWQSWPEGVRQGIVSLGQILGVMI